MVRAMDSSKEFKFEISLSVLNHLGRHLYRSFATVLGEAISNAWDANAENVWIYIDKKNQSFVIKDDGVGMDADEFQTKFLKIGYSKRKGGTTRSPSPYNRPYIGRKGIGKLALLSCARRVTITSRASGKDYVGGVIDNSNLDVAIKNDVTPSEYTLERVNLDNLSKYAKNQEKGTIIYFEGMHEGIRNSLPHIRKTIALYFRFSLLDESFKIFLDDDPVTLDDLQELVDSTEFVWVINNLKDPYVSEKLRYAKENLTKRINLLEPPKHVASRIEIEGFIASVKKPRSLKITDTDERVGVDLFVNGRLRERDILKHIPTARVVENYLYGQIHFNQLDDVVDRFATGREGIVADDEKFNTLLDNLREIVSGILEDWDKWRLKHREEGDSENTRIAKRYRKAGELFNVVSEEFRPPEIAPEKERERVDAWVASLADDAQYSFTSYAECYVSENLIRLHIGDSKLPLSAEAKRQIAEMKRREDTNKNKGNVSIDIRKTPVDISYLSMDGLANLVDKKDKTKSASLSRDAATYKPIRDALMHTALLTNAAKTMLTAVSENIKGRVRNLIADEEDVTE